MSANAVRDPEVAAGARILVVDDSRVNRLMLARLLTSLGHETAEAEDGRLALARLRDAEAAPIDVVLLDLVMPELDGYQTLEAIKADPALSSVPVIVISDVEDLASVVRCIEMGATDYLLRPFKPALLRARLAASFADKRLRDLEHETLERQAATNEVLKVISRSKLDLQAVLDAIVETAARLCQAEYGTIYLREDGVYRGVAGAGVAGQALVAAYERDHPDGPGRATVVGRVIETRGPVLIADVLADPEYEWPGQQLAGYRTLLGVPVIGDGEIVGIINMARNEVRPFSIAEQGVIAAFAEQAAIAIENARLLETIERQRTELARFVSPQIAALISSAEGEQLLAGHRRQITAMFADLRGFTHFSETAEPEELLGVLRAYHGAMGALVVEHGGTLEHFAGDGMLVFFNDPVPQDDHALRAVAMAIEMRQRFVELAQGWHKLGYELGLGIGISTGYATLGRIGFEGRYDYAAIGNAVILASRLSTEAKAGQILLGQRTYAAVEDLVEVEPAGELELKGISRPVPAYNVVGRTGSIA
ncbi:MAG: response regulator [Chloroflexota bacterium]|nr:response regulator [Chloroflexota bacterium]